MGQTERIGNDVTSWIRRHGEFIREEMKTELLVRLEISEKIQSRFCEWIRKFSCNFSKSSPRIVLSAVKQNIMSPQ